MKEVARDMVAEEFSAMVRDHIPVFEMPGGNDLHIVYNRETDCIDVGTVANAGLAVSHSFPYDHDYSLDTNLRDVHEKLTQMESEQDEEVSYGGGMHR